MQYGGLPSKNAICPMIVKELQYKISCTSCRLLVHTDYDAASDYDRITLILASLASRSHGQNKSITIINATTLKEAKFVLKTQLSTSEQHYTHTDIHPLYGIRQGARNSAAIWAMISSTLFSIFDENAQVSMYNSPDHTIKIQICMVGFVDDTSGSTTISSTPHYKKSSTISPNQTRMHNDGMTFYNYPAVPCNPPNAHITSSSTSSPTQEYPISAVKPTTAFTCNFNSTHLPPN